MQTSPALPCSGRRLSLPMSQDSMITNSVCTHYKGATLTYSAYAIFPDREGRTEDLKSWSKIMNSFQGHYHPITSSIPTSPDLFFHYTSRYNRLTKNQQVRSSNHLEKYTHKESDSYVLFSPLTFMFAVSPAQLNTGLSSRSKHLRAVVSARVTLSLASP